MGYLGLVPGERSTGETVRGGSITKEGNGRVRHMLVESACDISPSTEGRREEAVQYGARASESGEDSMEGSEPVDCAVSKVDRARKRTTVVSTAIARELSGFMSAVARQA
jgi:hypothetical protein